MLFKPLLLRAALCTAVFLLVFCGAAGKSVLGLICCGQTLLHPLLTLEEKIIFLVSMISSEGARLCV